jgi:DNA-binding NarL/FixJ family response regulator
MLFVFVPFWSYTSFSLLRTGNERLVRYGAHPRYNYTIYEEDVMTRTVKGRVGNQRSAHALTPRQQQILRLITEGLTSREIGKQLKISVQTVEVHRFNLMRRLEVRNVAQLIRQALVHNYLPKSYPQRTMTSTHS